MFKVKILADSITQYGDRLTTIEATYPRFIHSEIMTHREFSRNSASSRAIPAEKMLKNIIDNPVIPIHWGKNQSGMQAYSEIEDKSNAIEIWKENCSQAIDAAKKMQALGVHKQIINRIVEPYMWITTIISSTNWKHFYNLRVNPEAEPHIQKIASMIKEKIDSSTPTIVNDGEWHLPLILPEEQDLAIDTLKKVSVARCARVSYLTHDGTRDLNKDIELYTKLVTSKHWSPLEHVATPAPSKSRHGNFIGWLQHRKQFADEHLI